MDKAGIETAKIQSARQDSVLLAVVNQYLYIVINSVVMLATLSDY